MSEQGTPKDIKVNLLDWIREHLFIIVVMTKACQIFTEVDNFFLKKLYKQKRFIFAQSSRGTIGRLYHSMTVGVSCWEHVKVVRAMCGREHKARGDKGPGRGRLVFLIWKDQDWFQNTHEEVQKSNLFKNKKVLDSHVLNHN